MRCQNLINVESLEDFAQVFSQYISDKLLSHRTEISSLKKEIPWLLSHKFCHVFLVSKLCLKTIHTPNIKKQLSTQN